MNTKNILLLSLCILMLSAAGCGSYEYQVKDIKLNTKDFVPLFDGKTLNGWEILPGGQWKVEDGAIVGFQDKTERRHGMLLSEKTYTDFIVRMKYRSIKGNSGFYLRSERVKSGVSVNGFQAEIDAGGNDVGGIYETAGRYWVSRVPPEKVATFYKMHDWNEMVIKAVGKDTTVYVNGVKTVDLKNDPGRTKGYFGLQLHGGQDMHVEYKDIEIIDLSDTAQYKNEKELFDADLSNAIYPEGIWTVKDGVLTASKDKCIWTKAEYDNFVLDVEFKTEKGTNSGVILRNTNIKKWVPGAVEVQIAADYSEPWKSKPATWQCAAIFGHLAPTKSVVKKAGMWNRMRITCLGKIITVILNGEKVNEMDMDLWTSAKKNPDGSDIPPWLSKPVNQLPLKGRIGLQGKHAGAPIYFRNLRIRTY